MAQHLQKAIILHTLGVQVKPKPERHAGPQQPFKVPLGAIALS